MIERLAGTYSWRLPLGVILDVNGVGYGLELPERSMRRLPEPGEPLQLWVHTYVREDALKLYGFATYEEKLLFGLFLSLGGVGPKLAMAMLSSLDAPSLIRAVHDDDAAVLEEVPGIGSRQSKKILLEIKPKLEKMQAAGLLMNLEAVQGETTGPGATAGLFATPAKGRGFSKIMLEDLRSALNNFGYKDKEFMPVVKRLEETSPHAALPELIRLALGELSGASGATISVRRPEADVF
jgi:Holliday junction DNA helicase RuvA